MTTQDMMMGTRRIDPRERRPLKVRLPLERVLQLHRMRITGDQTVSEIVTQALEDYLAQFSAGMAKTASDERIETNP